MFGLPDPTMLNGMRVVESTMATTSEPVRTHKLTRSQLKHLEKHMFKGITYHDRIQKKWNKRFGFKSVPGCFIVDTSKLTFGGLNGGEKVILAHPTVIKAMKEHTREQEDSPETWDEIYNGMRKQAEDRLRRSEIMWKSEIDFNLYPIARNRNGVINMDCAV